MHIDADEVHPPINANGRFVKYDFGCWKHKLWQLKRARRLIDGWRWQERLRRKTSACWQQHISMPLNANPNMRMNSPPVFGKSSVAGLLA